MSWSSTLISLAGLAIALTVLSTISLVLLPFAALTTALAALILGLRVVAVYIELGIGILSDTITGGRASLFGRSPALFSSTVPPPPYARPRSARSTGSSSIDSQTPSHGASHSIGSISGGAAAAAGVGQSASVYSANPLGRDFEGIGGWRVAADDGDEGDSQWLTMNSRLELPVVSSIAPEERRRHQQHHHHHQRRATGGSLPGSVSAAEKRRSAGGSSGSASGGVVRSRAVGGSASASGASTPVDGQGQGHGRVKSLTQMGDVLVAGAPGSGGVLTVKGKVSRRKNSTSSSGSERTLVI